MADRDLGEVLTYFEEIFGSVVEHEVIKLILQSCDWDATTASDTLLGMIDKQNLAPHVLSSLNADSIARELARKQPTPEGGTPPSDQSVNMTPKNDDLIQVANYPSDTINKSTTSDSTRNTSSITVPSSASAFHNGSPSALQQALMEERQNANSPLSAYTLLGGESETSSPSFSPLRPNKSANPGTSLDLNASEWVLAPEFVPNAFNWKASDMDVKHSVWRQGMSSKFMEAVPASVPQNQQSKGKPGKKEEIISKILQGTKLLVLMRGLPGSGKTTLAKEIKGPAGIILSTDDFFCDKHGRYIYDPSKIGEAHQWNKHRAIQRLKQGKTPIIIDNTNLQAWEMKPYVQLALQYGYEVSMLDVDTSWKLSSKELARKNIHGVPAKKIEEMKGRYEHDVKLEDLIANLQGLAVTQQSPSRNGSTKIIEGNVSERSPKGKDIASKCSPRKTKKKPVIIDSNADEILTVENSEFDSFVKEEVFDSDEDVVIEGYDDRITLVSIHSNKIEVEVPHFDKNVTASESKIEEAPPNIQKSIIDTVLSEEIGNEVDAFANNLDSPIDLTLALRTNDPKEEKREDEALKSRHKSDTIHVNVLDNGNDTYDEIKMQTLLDEACKSIDFSKSEEDWDNLMSQIEGEDFSDEKFNDLVTSFGSALKKQIKNKSSIGIEETEDDKDTSDTINEDSAMYDFCSTMEDKTGQPLSALIAKLTKNEDSIDDTSIQLIGETNNESQTNNLSRNLVDEMRGKHVSDISGKEENIGLSNEKSKCDSFAQSTLDGSKDDSDKNELDKGSEGNNVTNCIISYESDKPASVDMTHCQLNSESLTSWECVDINSGLNSANWDAKSDKTESDKNGSMPKSCRSQRKRMPGDPSKWLKETNTSSENINDEVASWIAVEGGSSEWDRHDSPKKCSSAASPSRSQVTLSQRRTDDEPQSHTGAISKLRNHRRKNNSSSPNSADYRKDEGIPLNDCNSVIDYKGTKTFFKSVETQTLSIDFEALELDHDLYELKVLFGRSHYVPVTTVSSSFSEKGPLTKGGLRLDKGTMTDNLYESSVANSFQTLVAFFPNIPKEDLRDVFEKCKHDSDWAMNVLLDSGYEMSDPSDITAKNLTEADVETDSVSETINTDDGKNDNSSSDTCDIPYDSFSDEKTRKIKQSQLPEDIAKKIEIEKSFGFSESVDERVLRLTGKQYSDLNMTKIKKNKTKRQQHVKRNRSPPDVETKETVEEGGEGAQYITLLMDPLFASQLNMLFGPVGDCEISGDLTHEDRSVVLPLEICEMIHKYWARTVNGKFKHEAEILDSLVRQDEILARKLQEEENAAFNLDDKRDDINDSLPEDQPVCFQEIMNIEQALQESLSDRTHEDTSISSQLNLKRLYKEYPHVDPVALKEEYTRSGCKYSITVKRLNQRYGKEQGTPKTVIAPEALSRYEQQMIERAQQSSLEEQEQVMSSNQHNEIVPDDPQIYRDEAQTHYHQRQEAFRKAQEAFRQGMKTAAAYYAHIGNLHSIKLREANQRASEKILEAQNAHRKDANCLDLHLLHVPEAISATQAFLLERQRVLIARGIKQMEVSLITGRGAHSAGGQAVLKPSIKEHLQKQGYSFYEANSGMLRVVLRSKPS